MRSDIVSEWLAQSEWVDWQRRPLTGDASARRYERLEHPTKGAVIFMDAPPDSCGSQDRFVRIAKHLSEIDLKAPNIFSWDDGLGLMILEDLGPTDFAQHLAEAPNDERQLYEAAVDVILHLGRSTPPSGLPIMTPDIGAQMVDIAFDWAARDQSQQLAHDIKGEMTNLLAEVSADPSWLSLRDFHAENLIWRSRASDLGRVGLLDFQDAFVTHPAYDLASLLRDARRDVDPALVAPMLRRLGAGEDIRAAFHIHAVQRNLRILGIFERLAQQDQKIGYLNFVPRVRRHLIADLEAPEMSSIAPLITRAFNLTESSAP